MAAVAPILLVPTHSLHSYKTPALSAELLKSLFHFFLFFEAGFLYVALFVLELCRPG